MFSEPDVNTCCLPEFYSKPYGFQRGTFIFSRGKYFHVNFSSHPISSFDHVIVLG